MFAECTEPSNDDDEVTFHEAGDWIDEELQTLIERSIRCPIDQGYGSRLKEAGSYVGDDREMMVELSVDGKSKSSMLATWLALHAQVLLRQSSMQSRELLQVQTLSINLSCATTSS